MNQENFWVLFSKKLAGEITNEEMNELQDLIEKNPEWQYAIQNVQDIWQQKPRTDSIIAEDAYMLHLHRMDDMKVEFEELQTPSSNVYLLKKNRAKWYWAAAALLVTVSGIWLFSQKLSTKTEKVAVVGEKNEISTKPGSKSTVQLPDGSTVVLNAGSRLVYDKDYGKDIREVTLIGEGFFDVAKDKEKPFIIHTSAINIKVLGTVFNVKAYPEDKKTETSLIRGSIEVTIRNRPNDKIILSPSEKLVVDNDIAGTSSNAIQKTVSKPTAPNSRTLVAIDKIQYNPLDSTVAETLWTQNKLVFRDESFADLAVRMERWYNVKIEINNPALRSFRMNGIFQTETVVQALEALKESISFQYQQNGDKFIIQP